MTRTATTAATASSSTAGRPGHRPGPENHIEEPPTAPCHVPQNRSSNLPEPIWYEIAIPAENG